MTEDKVFRSYEKQIESVVTRITHKVNFRPGTTANDLAWILTQHVPEQAIVAECVDEVDGDGVVTIFFTEEVKKK